MEEKEEVVMAVAVMAVILVEVDMVVAGRAEWGVVREGHYRGTQTYLAR